MKGQNLRDLMESCIVDAGNDRKEGQRILSDKIIEAVDDNSLNIDNIDLQEVFNAMCNPQNTLDKNSSVAIQEAVSSSAFPYITGKLINKKIIPAYTLATAPVRELVTEIPIKRKNEDMAGFIDVELPDEVFEGMPYLEDSLGEKQVKIQANKTGRIISLTKEMVLFDQTNQMMTRANAITEKMAYEEYATILQRCTDVAVTRGGYATQTALVYDGTARASYSSDHSSWDDGANANDNLDTTTLGTEGMRAAMTLLRKLKDNAGEYISTQPTHMIVPANKEWLAKELLSSDLQFDSAQNARNLFKGSLKLIVSPILDDTSSYYWYIGDFKKDMVLGRVWPLKIETQTSTSESAFNSDIIYRVKASNYFGVNAIDYRHRVAVQATS